MQTFSGHSGTGGGRCTSRPREGISAGVDLVTQGLTSLHVACRHGRIDVARLCFERGAALWSSQDEGRSPSEMARTRGHAAMAAWLGRIQAVGWARYLSEPRYKLVVLRELAKGRAQRERAFDGKELVLDFLFPGAGQPPSRGNKQARRQRARLPDELFSIIRALLLGRRPVGRGGGRCRRRGRGPGRRGAGVESRDERPLPPSRCYMYWASGPWRNSPRKLYVV